MKLLVGLGNPDNIYRDTRHNIGFTIIDALASNLFPSELWQSSKKLHALYIKTSEYILIKPQTYMNESGLSVLQTKQLYKIDIKDIWVFQDDLDLPFNTFKIQTDRGSAGHNGIKSIIEHLGGTGFTRWRVGIGKSPIIPSADYVLHKFSSQELHELQSTINTIIESVKFAQSNDLIETIKKFH
ncbi:MAG: aminoacyl-tRNA hydrolase [bacterium]|nr:aminoacyl-tRNA hydrolase [bacterium]